MAWFVLALAAATLCVAHGGTRPRSLLALNDPVDILTVGSGLASVSLKQLLNVSVSVERLPLGDDTPSGVLPLVITVAAEAGTPLPAPGWLALRCPALNAPGEGLHATAGLVELIPLPNAASPTSSSWHQLANGTHALRVSESVAQVELQLPHIARCAFTAEFLSCPSSSATGDEAVGSGLPVPLWQSAGCVASPPTPAISVLAATAPRHARLAYGPVPQTEMWLSWTADDNSSAPFVLVGTQPANYTMRISGSWSSYLASDMCGAGANETSLLKYLWPGYFGHVLVTGLAPGTRYYLVYGSDPAHLARETSFVTAKAAGPDVPVRFAAFGDHALSPWPGAFTTVEAILALNDELPGGIDFTALFGDLGYAEGSTIVWDAWHVVIESATRKMPWLMSNGNHEVDHTTQPCSQNPSRDEGADGTGFHPTWGDYGDDSSGEGGVASWHRLRSPGYGPFGNATGGNGNGIAWYSATVGSVHVVMLSSEHDMTPGSWQYSWLAGGLLKRLEDY